MDSEIIIIGAGPAGSVAASMLTRMGRSVTVLESATFPRFSIGESLLPQMMEFLEEADLLKDVVQHGFQFKNGALFARGDELTSYDFRQKLSPGWGTTYQVRRDQFDELLAKGAERHGAKILFKNTVTSFMPDPEQPSLRVRDEHGDERTMTARMVLDASGFGRVLARLLDLEQPAAFPPRMALFTHFKDHISAHDYDRNKILISVHPENHAIWYWMIPLANGQTSAGVVGEVADITAAGATREDRYKRLLHESGLMGRLLSSGEMIRDIGEIAGYACKVKGLWGPGYVLLGNAGEFLDPIFSSGVTIALKSASLATKAADRQLNGEAVDWDADFSRPLVKGIDTFRTYVASWYDGSLQRIIFNQPRNAGEITRSINAVLAGYAWDDANPFVRDPGRYLSLLKSLCG